MDHDPVVLVVDDDADTRDMLQEYLAANGCRVLTAANGVEALEIAATQCPTVVLLDINMPHLSGLEVVHIMREQRLLPGARFIAMTGLTGADAQALALQRGFDRVVAKPYDIETVLAIVRETSPGA